MMQNTGVPIAAELMSEFAEVTGLAAGGEARKRYLWTDAFAVCNFLGLYRETGDAKYRDLALLLVDRVHEVLGRHRPDDSRRGWISGLEESEGARHPAAGGLRIGKKLKERGPGEPLDERLEWDRDGQYFHYLTRWIHALDRVSSATGEPVYRRWAAELAKTAYARFTHVPIPGAPMQMYWKMSIDLSYPLVRSMGHHDPLDGLSTFAGLRADMAGGREAEPADLEEEIAGLAAMCEGRDWTTDDPLGIGGMLCDAHRLAQIMTPGFFSRPDILADILDACRYGLLALSGSGSLESPAEYRLAFRELGLSIGLHALERLYDLVETKPEVFGNQPQLPRQIEALLRYSFLADMIEHFWLEPANGKVAGFVEHRDINTVMLAASLVPDGYLAP